MTRRFSSQELSYLRNQVPIAGVIDALPDLANGTGKSSFACPVCRGMNTSINAAHNLARCFDCRQNFNPIELVMHHLQFSFVDSVKWLKQRATGALSSNKRHNNSQPTSIGETLTDILPKLSDKKSDTASQKSITQRISKLENSLKDLHLLVEELRSSLKKG